MEHLSFETGRSYVEGEPQVIQAKMKDGIVQFSDAQRGVSGEFKLELDFTREEVMHHYDNGKYDMRGMWWKA